MRLQVFKFTIYPIDQYFDTINSVQLLSCTRNGSYSKLFVQVRSPSPFEPQLNKLGAGNVFKFGFETNLQFGFQNRSCAAKYSAESLTPFKEPTVWHAVHHSSKIGNICHIFCNKAEPTLGTTKQSSPPRRYNSESTPSPQ